MKKNVNFYLRTAAMLSMAMVMFFGAALFTGCEDKDEEPQVTPSLVVSPKTIPGIAAGGDYTVQVVANVAWTASVTAGSDFITLTSASGTGDGSFTVNLAEIADGASRTGTITVTGEGLTEIITVSQTGLPWSLVVTPAEFTDLAFGPATVLTVTVTANVPWTAIGQDPGDGSNGHFPLVWNIAEVNPPGSGFITATGSGTFQVYVPANPGLESRSGTVTVTGTGDGAGLSQVITFTQLAEQKLTVTPDNFENVPAAGTELAVTVAGNVNWTATANGGFITVSPGAGAGAGNLTITVAKNETGQSRSGSVVVQSGDLTRTITISQIDADPTVMLYVEIGNLRWAKYNLTAAGAVPAQLSLGTAFPVANTADACPDGWRLPTLDEWKAISGENGSEWGLHDGASVRQNVNGVNGFFMAKGAGDAPIGSATIDTHVFVPFINAEESTPIAERTPTAYAIGNSTYPGIRITPWDNGINPQKFWVGADNEGVGAANGYRVRCVQNK